MQTILSSFEHGSLLRELRDHDARQLLDIGLVRAADGSLRLASDPDQPVGPDLPRRRWKAFLEGLSGFFRYLRSLPFRSHGLAHGLGPIFFNRE